MHDDLATAENLYFTILNRYNLHLLCMRRVKLKLLSADIITKVQ
jgi:hypothetical protein